MELPPPPEASARSRHLAFLVGLLVLSGAASLAMEMVAARVLARGLGSTSASLALVAGAFLAGLGVGAWCAERLRLFRGAPLVGYAVCELTALGLSLLLPPLAEGVASATRGAFRAALLALLLVVLCVPWGASLPILLGTLAPREAARWVRRIYGWNALGGAAGALVAGLSLLPTLGERGTVLASAALQAIGAGGALLLARRSPLRVPPASLGSAAPARPSSDPGAAEATGVLATSNEPGPVLVLLFLSGLCVLYWEVYWTRVLALVVGGTVFAFSAMSASVLVGIGLGSLAFGDRRRFATAAVWLPAVTFVVLQGAHPTVSFLPDAYLAAVRALPGGTLWVGALGAASLLLLPNLLLGAFFPWVTSTRLEGAGSAYAASAAGSFLGAVLGGVVLWGTVDPRDLYALGLGLVAALGVVGFLVCRRAAVVGAPRPRRPSSTAFAAAAATVAVVVLFERSSLGLTSWDLKRLLSGVYQWSRADLETASLAASLEARELLVVRVGREAVVSVEAAPALNTLSVKSNGKTEGTVPLRPAEASVADLPTQILLGLLPRDLFASRTPLRATLIGLGSGVTLGALLASGEGDPRRLEVEALEIEPAFLEVLAHPGVRPYLERLIPGALLDAAGKRPRDGLTEGLGGGPVTVAADRWSARLRFGDARRILADTEGVGMLDVIVSQPSEPWVPGAASLFTLEFFEEAARLLVPAGVFVQWVQIYKVDLETIRVLARTFRRAFPSVYVLRPPGTGNIILLGSRERLRLETLLEAPESPFIAATGLEVPADRLAVFLLGPAGVDSWVGLDPLLEVNTDDRTVIAYRGARGLQEGAAAASGHLAALRALGGRDPIHRYLAEPLRSDRSFLRLLAARNLRLGDFEEARADLEGDPSAEARRLLESIESEAADSAPR